MEKRFELKYNEQRMRHYAVDHERKTQLSHEDMINLLNEQEQKIKSETAEKEFWQSAYRGAQNGYDLIFSKYQKVLDQLHTQPKEIIEKIKQSNIYLNSSKPNQKGHIYDSYLVEAKTLDKILKEYERKNV